MNLSQNSLGSIRCNTLKFRET